MSLPPVPVLRAPLYGAIGPRTTIAVHLDPPLSDERLTVLSTDPKSVVYEVRANKPDAVVVSNQSDRPVAYTLLFTPGNVVLPPPEAWKDLWDQVKAKLAGLQREKL